MKFINKLHFFKYDCSSQADLKTFWNVNLDLASNFKVNQIPQLFQKREPLSYYN